MSVHAGLRTLGGIIDILIVLGVIWAVLVLGFTLGWIVRVLLVRRTPPPVEPDDDIRIEPDEAPREIDLREHPAQRPQDGQRDGDET